MFLNSPKYVELWENCMWQPLIRNGNLHCVLTMCTIFTVHTLCSPYALCSPCAVCAAQRRSSCVPTSGACDPHTAHSYSSNSTSSSTSSTRSATRGTHACWPQGQVVQIREVCWEQRPRVCRILCGPITNFLSARVLLDKHTWNTAEQTHKHCKHKEPPLHICVWPLRE